jgi:uncharacterized RDD family membrane protein YckC
MEYAGFWRRFTAYFLDNVILAFAELVFLFVLGLVLQLTGITDSINKDETSQIIAGTFLLILIIVNWLYFSLMESSKFQATVGKIALNIKVVDYEGKKISFKLATIRYFSKLLSALILFIGFFMAGFTKRKQALHDLIAKTTVIKN